MPLERRAVRDDDRVLLESVMAQREYDCVIDGREREVGNVPGGTTSRAWSAVVPSIDHNSVSSRCEIRMLSAARYGWVATATRRTGAVWPRSTLSGAPCVDQAVGERRCFREPREHDRASFRRSGCNARIGRLRRTGYQNCITCSDVLQPEPAILDRQTERQKRGTSPCEESCSSAGVRWPRRLNRKAVRATHLELLRRWLPRACMQSPNPRRERRSDASCRATPAVSSASLMTTGTMRRLEREERIDLETDVRGTGRFLCRDEDHRLDQAQRTLEGRRQSALRQAEARNGR